MVYSQRQTFDFTGLNGTELFVNDVIGQNFDQHFVMEFSVEADTGHSATTEAQWAYTYEEAQIYVESHEQLEIASGHSYDLVRIGSVGADTDDRFGLFAFLDDTSLFGSEVTAHSLLQIYGDDVGSHDLTVGAVSSTSETGTKSATEESSFGQINTVNAPPVADPAIASRRLAKTGTANSDDPGQGDEPTPPRTDPPNVGPKDDNLEGGAGADTLRGGGGEDTLSGNGGPDTLIGGAGDDLLRGGGGADSLIGGAGADTLAGNGGQDDLSGKSGQDVLSGGGGRDSISGGRGADTLSGNGGKDILSGGGGSDVLGGDAGRDTLTGGRGADTLSGDGGRDVLDGGDGDDILFGGRGNDTLEGGPGADLLDGGGGADVLIATHGDTLIGGSGNDIHVFEPGNLMGPGEVEIQDFQPGGDRIDLSGFEEPSSFDELVFIQNGDDVELVIEGTVITITTVTIASFSPKDFILSNGEPNPANPPENSNDAPVAEPATASGDEDTAITGTLVASDVDGDELTFAVASDPSNGSVTVTAAGAFTYTPNADFIGDDSFTYTVTDGNGGSATETISLTVNPVNDAPVAEALNASGDEDAAITGTLVASDVDGDELTFAAASVPSNGSVTVTAAGAFTYTPDADFNGDDSFTYTVIDGIGGSATETVSLTVNSVNDDPVAEALNASGDEGTAITGALVASDVDGDDLTFAVADDPSNGSVTITEAGAFAYTPTDDFNGDDSFTYTVSDGNGGSDTATVTLTMNAVNDDPVAEDATASGDEDNAITGQLSAADVDGDDLTFAVADDPLNGSVTITTSGSFTYTPADDFNGEDSFTYTVSDGNGGSDTATVTLTVSAVNDDPVAEDATASGDEDNAITGQLSAADVDGDDLTFAIGDDPSNGSVTITTSGSFTYTPADDFNGDDSFTYTVTDGNGGSATETVNLTVNAVNDDPVAEPLSASGDEGATISGMLVASDVDGDDLSFAVASDPSNGSVTVTAVGAFAYTPGDDFNGDDSFTYTVTDGNGGSATETVSLTVNPVNDAPVAQALSATGDEDATITGTLMASDVDGDDLTFAVASDPSNGSVTITAAGAFTYTPDADFNGDDSFSYTVTDGNGGSATETVSLTVNPLNDAPVAEPLSASGDEGATISGMLVASDVDGDDLSFAVASDPSNGSVTVTAAGAFTYTPDDDFNGEDSFTYTVTDGNGGSATETVSLTVNAVNDDPAAEPLSATGDEDATISGTLMASDVDGDALTFAAANDPSNGSVTITAAGAFTYTPDADFNGDDSFTYTVTDGNGGSATETVSLTVNPLNDAPVAQDATATVGEDDIAATTITAVFTDVDASDTHTFTVDDTNTQGEVTNNGDGTFSYDPNGQFESLAVGELTVDEFSYSVIDSGGGVGTATATVTITGTNDAPVVDAIAATTLLETSDSSDITGDIAVSFTDADLTDIGHTATITSTGTSGDTDGLTLDAAALAALISAGAVTKTSGSADGALTLSFAAASSAFSYLRDSQAVTLNYSVTIDDGDGGSADAAFTVTVNGTAALIELSEVALPTDARGFVINGVSMGDQSGFSVSSAGDVNGDGLDDLIIGARYDDPNGVASGASFVVFGKADTGVVELSDIEAGTGGFVINGVSVGDRSGRSVSSAGDVNGDGLDDLIIGARNDDPNGITNSGASFVVFGKADTGVVELSDIEAGTGGFVINGVSAYDLSGISVSSAGDVNGDGLDDLIVGATGDDQNGDGAGASFVVFGKADNGAVELSDINSGNGFKIIGVSASDENGKSVASAGDVNGDGLDDLIIGAPNDDPNGTASGASFVVFGKTDSGAVELSDIETGAGGFVINGVSAGDRSGGSVSSAGDVNGDGLNDLIIGARFDGPNGVNSGASFVVFGKADGSVVELSDIEAGTGGFVINGVSGGDQSGYSVSSAGDVNGDGLDDLIIGAIADDPNGVASGASFVVFGKAYTGVVELSEIETGAGGFVINGESGFDYSGMSVSSAGDVNGDGFDDLIIGARGDNPNGTNSGASFVVFGGDFTGAATHVGTTGDDTLTGSAAADVLIGGTGADVLAGGGGADVLRGGEGNDVLGVSDLTFARLDGGNGVDTLRLDGAGLTLDLTVIASPEIEEVERIDLTGGGNTLRLDTAEVLGLSGESNTVRVLGAAGDIVRLVGTQWAAAGDVTDAEGTFDVFTDGLARIEIAQDLTLIGGPIAPVELSEVALPTNARGFVINGVSANDLSGVSVSSAGDVNGDGLDDLIIGAQDDDPNGFRTGASFVVFGKTDGGVVELSAIEAGTGGFVINGVSAGDQSGTSVSSAGDVNGDGLDDLIIGARFDDPNGDNSGASFVVFGKGDTSAVELSDIEAGIGGFVINGVAEADLSGSSVSSAGDVNGDGLDDLIVGAEDDDPNGPLSGASFVIFGKADGSVVELSEIETGLGGFVINGANGRDRFGGSVSSAGDVNGDGLNDLIIGARAADYSGTDSGAGFVVFGRANTSEVALSDIEAGIGGFLISGGSADDQLGGSVSFAGDVNGDGLDDLIIGADGDEPNGVRSGASFVVFGKVDGDAVRLSDIKAGTGGFVINGASRNDASGRSVSSAGDVNGDGLDDLIIGVPGDEPNGVRSGTSFLVFGKADGGAVELSEVSAGIGGFVVNGASAGDNSGSSVSSAGDVNGDGFDDLIIGAILDDPNGDNSGASFVVFGGDFTNAATQVGTTGNDTLTGSAVADVLIGGTGADVLAGGGGADVLRGGEGDDVLGVSDLTFARLDGGNGVDTLRLDGVDLVLDLTVIASPEIEEVERIDLTGGGNTLRLDTAEVLGLSGESNTVRVLGGAGDIVRLVGTQWAAAGDVTDAEGTFDVFTDGLARIEIAQDLTLIGGPIAPIELSEVELSTDARGFVINGVSARDYSGSSVSSAGDVNGDGFDDLIIGAPSDDPNGSISGASFVVFGRADGGAVELSDIETGDGGFVINGVSAGDRSGYSVSSAGDVNGDGLDDLIIGARSDDPNGVVNSGASFVVFAKADGGAVELSDIELGVGGFAINGIAEEDFAGTSVSSAGDVNGDGLDDLIVSAPNADPNGVVNSGASFVVFGKADGNVVQLSGIDAGTEGFVINGVASGDSGRSVSAAGDVNGDGLDDLIIGAPSADPNGRYSGASFVVFGKADGGTVELSDIETGTGGFVFKGVSAGDMSGRSVSSAGDVNGDGLDDLIIGAPLGDPNGLSSGASYVVFGKDDDGVVELSDIEAGTGGFVINGVSPRDRSGRSVSSAGDVNGDGLDDLIIGAPYDDPNGSYSGASFVVFGKDDDGVVELSDIEAGTGGFVINGVSADDLSGLSVSSAGDVNGDGFYDLIVGAFRDDPNGEDSGASFVVFGGDFTGAATQVGTTGNDTLTGSAVADVLFAGTGADVINGGGGDNRLSGGAGDDVFVFQDNGGNDTVIDFENDPGGQDILDISAFDFADLAAVQAVTTANGPGGHDLLITLDDDDSILLEGVDLTDLTADSFLF